jgi:YD repeat-containing protein
VFSYDFDSLNRLIQTIDEESNTVTLTRNGVGRRYRLSGPAIAHNQFRPRRFRWNHPGSLARQGNVGLYVRDARGNVIQRTDPRGSIASFADPPISDASGL